ncbi:hypothetical protein JCM19241_2354 [Vibrio ishigakensis]|uniref:Uncharacterized protein n=1 Tax=Vibrio ishigakensis TaxID=1481914 RepID=A0A0B8QE28_9VIBR|nr:hypothetical protein JCM19241_2354 [Vibrio ishigakensis]
MPSSYPVVFNGRYVGLLQRDAIAAWIANFYQPEAEQKEELSVA